MRRSVPVALLAVLAVAGCTDGGTGGGAGGDAAAGDRPVRVVTGSPAPLTAVADPDPVSSAIDTSRALFARSGVAVVARSGDRSGELLGASAAVGLGVPLLLSPGSGSPQALTAELDRLSVTSVLAVGDRAGAGLARQSGSAPERAVVSVPAAPAAVADAAGIDLGAVRQVADDAAVGTVAALTPQHPAALRPQSAAAPTTHAGADGLPRVQRGRALTGTLVLTTGAPEDLAGVASARAAGARVQLTGGSTDPRASADVVSALSGQHPRSVVALGAGFAAEQGLDWKLATAASGQQLPGGGQLVFPGHSLVALYGTPGTASLGLLGEQDLPASIQRAKDMAAKYDGLLPAPVVPTFEIIATVASGAPGPDGNYSTELDPATLRPWVDEAARAGLYVVLDLQPGRSDFLSQAEQYRSLLELPNVGLALDPEWRLAPGQRPLEQIGSVGIDEINRVVTWLADLTRAGSLPQKVFIVHQFKMSSIVDRDRLDTSRPELAVTIHADGQGTQPVKQGTWQVMHHDLPPGPLYWGWKNFIDEDHPTLTPQQTVTEVSPLPNLVTYQ